jgi:protein-tyrosine kinase
MSIIESAVNRAKDSLAHPPREARPVVDGRAAVAAPLAQTPARRHQSTTLDLDSMRRAGMLPPEDHARSLAEEFRRIKWPLVAAAIGKAAERLARGNLLLVTSAVPGEGKSFVSLNLAMSVATERDCRVLLIDADTVKPRASRLCGLIDRPGLTDLLFEDSRDIDEFIFDTNVAGLEVLPVGRADSRSPELFASRRAERCLVEMAERHPDQVIIIDSAPLLAASEAQVLARIAGQVVMVVRADWTARREVTDAIALLEKGAVVRFVLNQMPTGLFSEQYCYKYKNESR